MTDWISFLLVGSENYSSHNYLAGFLVLATTKAYFSLFNIAAIILRPDKYNDTVELLVIASVLLYFKVYWHDQEMTIFNFFKENYSRVQDYTLKEY